MKFSLFYASLSFYLVGYSSASVVSLTPETYDSATAGKAAFIKFFAPWCGHCKAMAADWEKLAADYEGDDSVIIAEVDCTEEENRGICSDNSVQGFPTIKYGDSSMLEDYQGGRSYDDLKEFAAENLKLSCSPFNMDLCEGDDKVKIEKYFALSPEELTDAIDKVEAILAEAEEEVETGVEKLQAAYEALMEEHEAKVKSTKEDSDFKMLKAVLAVKNSETGNEEL